MKRTNTKEFNKAFQQYLAPIIKQRADDYNDNPENVWQWAIDTARAEIPHEFDRHGTQSGLSSWLAGCALNIAVYNGDIIAVAERLHGCKLTDKQADKVISKWFDFVALKINQYARS
jgi:hypothetical protein